MPTLNANVSRSEIRKTKHALEERARKLRIMRSMILESIDHSDGVESEDDIDDDGIENAFKERARKLLIMDQAKQLNDIEAGLEQVNKEFDEIAELDKSAY